MPNGAIDTVDLTRCWLILARRALDACDMVAFRAGPQVLAPRTLGALRFADLVLSWGAKDTVILLGFVPHLEFAANFISLRVANLRVKHCTFEVGAVVPFLQSATRPHVRAACFPQHGCRSVIRLAGTVSETLELFELVHAECPLSLVVAVLADHFHRIVCYSVRVSV